MSALGRKPLSVISVLYLMATACRVLLDLLNTTLPSKAWLWAFNSLSSPVVEAALKLLMSTE